MCLFHREPNHVGKRPFDFCDDLRALSLSGVGSRFIQWIHSRKIVVDLSGAEAAKANMRNLINCGRSSRGEVTNKNRGTHFVRSSAQTP